MPHDQQKVNKYSFCVTAYKSDIKAIFASIKMHKYSQNIQKMNKYPKREFIYSLTFPRKSYLLR